MLAEGISYLQAVMLVSCSLQLSNTWGLSLSLGTSSNLAAKLKQELQPSDHLDASFMAYMQYRGMFSEVMESMREKEVLSPQLKVIYC